MEKGEEFGGQGGRDEMPIWDADQEEVSGASKESSPKQRRRLTC